MSRARPIKLPGSEPVWFDMLRNGQPATEEQLELLAAVKNAELDDVFDADYKQGEVLELIREALGHNRIPAEVLSKRDADRVARQTQPACRVCGKEGDSTKHHFVNKWILRELSYYASRWADRSKNCIPLCVHCHREVHSRANGAHSIIEWLTEKEREFAQAALQQLAEERPKLYILIAQGDDSVYETRLVRDHIEGKFRLDEESPVPNTPAEILELAA